MAAEVDMSNAIRKVCKCGGELFEPACKVYTISAIVSPTGREMTVQKPVFVCIDCKQPLN